MSRNHHHPAITRRSVIRHSGCDAVPDILWGTMACAASLTLSPSNVTSATTQPKSELGQKLRLLFALSVALNIAFCLIAGCWVYKRGGLRYVTAKHVAGIDPGDYARAKRELYRDVDRVRPSTHPTVMFGDSLTSGGLWGEWFGPNVLNRGVGGENTREAASRAPDIADLHPARVFILLGTNDFEKIAPRETQRNLNAIIHTIHDRSPRSEIFIQSVLPAPQRFRVSWVYDVNHVLRSVAVENHAHWIDLTPAFANGEVMRQELTVDGVHLNVTGYAVWKNELAPFVLASAEGTSGETHNSAPRN